MERPDLGQAAPAVRAYIEALEMELAHLRQRAAPPRERATAARRERPAADEENEEELPESLSPPEPSEPPTPLNVVTVSAGGLAKRTPRHLYGRQRRGGMGILDLEVEAPDQPTFLAVADDTAQLVLITNRARGFRVPVALLPTSPPRARGQSLVAGLGLYPDERLAAILPGTRSTYVAMLSERGWAVCLPGHLLAENLRPSNVFYDVQKHGQVVSACWAHGDQELLMVSHHGLGVRLGIKQVPSQGCLAIRLEPEDLAVAIVAIHPEGGVFLAGADGRGSVRLMSGFAPFKGPGTLGKQAFKSERLVGAAGIAEGDDLFIITRGGKLTRFRASEVPAKEAAVQGVNCMDLRAMDEVVTFTASG